MQVKYFRKYYWIQSKNKKKNTICKLATKDDSEIYK